MSTTVFTDSRCPKCGSTLLTNGKSVWCSLVDPSCDYREAIVGEPLCLGIEHRWQETYYGYKCIECGEFVPFGSEPWIDAGNEAESDGDEADRCPECDTPGIRYEDLPADGLVIAHCEGCGGWEDSYIDLYGCMSVPWGFV